MRNKILTELKLRSTDWANVSDKRFDRDPITIVRGKQGTEGAAGPSQANVTLNNTGGVFSQRNPNSLIAGQFGRNTPIRVSVVRDESSYGLVLARAGNGNARTLDNALTSITGDIDVRIDLELLDDGDTAAAWKWPTADFDLCSKWNFFPGELSWAFLILSGTPHLRWSADGTAGLSANATTTLAGPDKGRRALRFTLDVDNGAAGRTARFYQAPTIAGPWTQIGVDVVQAGVTSIFDGPANNRVGAAAQNNAWTWGRSGPSVVYDYEIRNGINGTLVADPDFRTQPLDPVPFGSSSWTDVQGNGWFLAGSADAARIWYGKTWTRYVGEVAEWPPRWDPSHRSKYVPITANGILRRLGQGKAPLKTGLRDFILRSDLVDALAFYVPLSGAEGATYSLNIAPNNYYLQTKFYPWAFVVQQPVYTYGQDMGASWIGTGLQINATGDTAAMIGDPATGDQNVALDLVFQSLSLGVFTVQLQDYSGNLWTLVLDTPTNDGTLQVSFNDPAVGPIGFAIQGPFTELQDANLHHLRFQLTKSGSDTQFAVYIDGTLRSSGTMAGYVLNGWARFSLFYSRYVNQTYVNIAHIACWANANAAQIPPIADTVAAAFGYSGETAAARITRLCTEGKIPLAIIGDPATSTVMGPQFAEPRLAAIRDAEQTDFGILTEQRGDNGLLYRTRASQYNQTPALTVDYSAKVVAPPFEPTDDDASTRNDVTASRRDGGSFNLTLPSGAMSVLDPPAGIGQYEDEITVNVQTDAQLPGAAGWWLSLGTLDAARFPSVTFNLAAQEIQNNPTLMAAILALEVGDRLPITNIDLADIPDDVDLIVQGYTETLTNSTWTITFNCAPGQPYQVAKFGTSRFDAEGSTLAVGVNSSALSMQFASLATSALWTTDVSAFPFDVNMAGERITVTGITGAASPQTAAVVRSVNGVVAAHAAGTTVKLWDTPRFAY
jgi:hypothetical protein